MAARKKDTSVSEITGLFKESLNNAYTRPTIHGYVPHEKQVAFHSASERTRLYIGGNRSGKTVGGIVEDIWRLRGQHPYLSVRPAPVEGRIVTVSYNEGIQQIIIPAIARWLPPSDLINGSWEDSYSKQHRVLTLSNGSTCELMSYDQAIEKFAGTARDFIHFDEEPPKAIYKECNMRLIDRGGVMYFTMTPVEGMTWIYDDIYQKGLTPGGHIKVITIDTEENPYISNAEMEIALEGLDDKERKARKQGQFVEIGGQVYKQFSPGRNTIAALDEATLDKIKHWTHYASMDHGLNNPTAWLWHAVSPTGLIVTYDEVYKNEELVEWFAARYHEHNALPHRVIPRINVGDPSIAQRNAQTGDSIQLVYQNHGISIVLGNNNVELRVDKMNSYLKSGRWVITENCPNLLRELPRVKWKIYDSAKKRDDNNPRREIHKKDDHAPDSCGYFFNMMPDLFLPEISLSAPQEMTPLQIIQQAIAATTVMKGPVYYDEGLRRSLANAGNSAETEWAVDEYGPY